MKLKIKIVVTTLLWATAIGLSVAFTFGHRPPVALWAMVAAAAAAVLSAALVGDYIAAEASQVIVDKITAERHNTVARAAKQIQDKHRAREDRIVSRIQSTNEAAIRRVAEELVRAIRQGDTPTPIR